MFGCALGVKMACSASTRRQTMNVQWKNPADARKLRELVSQTASAKQRDRYRVVRIAGEGLGEQHELHRQQIVSAVGRSRQFVDEWVVRYRTDGMDGIVPPATAWGQAQADDPTTAAVVRNARCQSGAPGRIGGIHRP